MKKQTRPKKTTTVKTKKQTKLKLVKEVKKAEPAATAHPFARFIKYDHHINPQHMYAHSNVRARRRIA